jgi:hypothetical protein
MVARVSGRQWLPFALCFLDAYGKRRVVGELIKLLVVPKGMEALWWDVRTLSLNRAMVRRRFKALRRALDARAEGEARKPLRGKNPRHLTPARAARVR